MNSRACCTLCTCCYMIGYYQLVLVLVNVLLYFYINPPGTEFGLFVLGLQTLRFLFAVGFLCGVNQEKKRLLISWGIFATLLVMLKVVLTGLSIILLWSPFSDLLSMLFIIIDIFCLVTVHSYYRQLKKKHHQRDINYRMHFFIPVAENPCEPIQTVSGKTVDGALPSSSPPPGYKELFETMPPFLFHDSCAVVSVPENANVDGGGVSHI
ncbi:hypothetical protein BV898_00261 [Hypsibius exemplaris]|uniref:Uncharacterized protein n=1 Tax=Hypsibius exemplaris TaxID=2072580 RepID=A0A1W0XF76_HYPEX|nr:hypothetical protein BV898_00261 [Hypsibius exemplaris]